MHTTVSRIIKNLMIVLTMFAAVTAAVFVSPLWGMKSGAAEGRPQLESGDGPYLLVLGVAQDGGCPHAGCTRECCREAWSDPSKGHLVACLAIVDPRTNQRWIIDATPDFPAQLHMLDSIAPPIGEAKPPALDGILLTHGHIGHYTGLMHLGREVMGAKGVPVFAMPRMREFLSHNGPRDQLVRLDNIAIRALEADTPVALNDRITITPIIVPHRDEYTETVGFKITGTGRSAVYIPDIDKWEKWDRRIEDVLAEVDVAFLDGTFFADGEILGRSMAEVPHPFVTETMKRLALLPAQQQSKVHFIHLNHTNPALKAGSDAVKDIERQGLHVAHEGDRISLEVNAAESSK